MEGSSVKLAAVHLVESPFQVKGIAQAGPEPLSSEFTVEALAGLVQGQRRQAKKFLTDQKAIAGIGTAYADEILFEAQISPTRFVNTLCDEEVERLYEAIRGVLGSAIEVIRARAGDRPFTKEIRDFLRIYNRAGEPCPVCGTQIAEVRRAQTNTYYCPTCQAGGKSLPDRRSWLRR